MRPCTTSFVAVAVILFSTITQQRPLQGFETAKTNKINIIIVDETKGDPPENQELFSKTVCITG